MPYQVGYIDYLKSDDPVFDDYEKAIRKAIEMSINDSFVGIWTSQDEGSECIAVVYALEVFEKR